jgi:hypothetical protein
MMGTLPPGSKGHVLAASGRSLYLFGGYIESGELRLILAGARFHLLNCCALGRLLKPAL